MGSLAGGTVLTITGRFFVLEKEHVKVTVEGKIFGGIVRSRSTQILVYSLSQ